MMFGTSSYRESWHGVRYIFLLHRHKKSASEQNRHLWYKVSRNTKIWSGDFYGMITVYKTAVGERYRQHSTVRVENNNNKSLSVIDINHIEGNFVCSPNNCRMIVYSSFYSTETTEIAHQYTNLRYEYMIPDIRHKGNIEIQFLRTRWYRVN